MEISHKDSMANINEDKRYRELKESIGMMNSQRSDTEKNNLMQECKKQALMKLLSVMKLPLTV